MGSCRAEDCKQGVNLISYMRTVVLSEQAGHCGRQTGKTMGQEAEERVANHAETAVPPQAEGAVPPQAEGAAPPQAEAAAPPQAEGAAPPQASPAGDVKKPSRISSPEQVDDYIRVTTPGMWLLVTAILVLLAALIIWGFTAKLEMETRSPDGQVTTQTVTPVSFVTDGMTGS